MKAQNERKVTKRRREEEMHTKEGERNGPGCG